VILLTQSESVSARSDTQARRGQRVHGSTGLGIYRTDGQIRRDQAHSPRPIASRNRSNINSSGNPLLPTYGAILDEIFNEEERGRYERPSCGALATALTELTPNLEA
jgi:hypothetical protein